MQNVERKAIPAVKEAVENNEISIFTANEISKLNEKEKRTLVQQGDLSSVKPKDIRQINTDTSENQEKVDTSINFSEDELDSQQSDGQDTEKNLILISTFQIQKMLRMYFPNLSMNTILSLKQSLCLTQA